MDKNDDIINRFLLAGDKFKPETHLYQPKIGKYSAVVHLQTHKKNSKFYAGWQIKSHLKK